MAEKATAEKPKRAWAKMDHHVLLDRALEGQFREYVKREWQGDKRVVGPILRKALKEFLDRQAVVTSHEDT